jgi:hypothetical protein
MLIFDLHDQINIIFDLKNWFSTENESTRFTRAGLRPDIVFLIDTHRDTLRAHSSPLLNLILNVGKLGRVRREGEFEKLTDEEVTSIEAIVREAFQGFED